MGETIFRQSFTVRDYECDLTGIVNNANYMHYLEHARHMYLKQRGVNFADWFQRGISLVIVRVEMDFLTSLRSGDRFFVGLNIERVSRLRFGFDQDIFRLDDLKPILKAKVVGTGVNRDGRPELPDELAALLYGDFPAAK